MEGFIIVLVITLVGQCFLVTALLIEDYFKTKIEFIVTCIPIVGLLIMIIEATLILLEELNDFYKNLN